MAKSVVFVVDDEVVIAKTLAIILRNEGFDAIAFHSPEQALERAKETAPDLLISDVAMPGMTGIELAIQMKSRFPQCKILLFSGQSPTIDWQRAREKMGMILNASTSRFIPRSSWREFGTDCSEVRSYRKNSDRESLYQFHLGESTMMTKVWPNQSEILSDRARRDPPIRLTRGHEKKIGVAGSPVLRNAPCFNLATGCLGPHMPLSHTGPGARLDRRAHHTRQP